LNIANLSIAFLLATATAFSSSAQTPAVSAGGGSGLARPATQAQLQALLQAAMNGQSVMLDPTTSVTVSSTMTILVPDNPGNIFGNGLKIRSTINNGSDVLQFVGSAKANSRNFIIQGINIYGGGYGGQASGNCFVINAPHSKGSLYRVVLRDMASRSLATSSSPRWTTSSRRTTGATACSSTMDRMAASFPT
jgi:hypothetical protein